MLMNKVRLEDLAELENQGPTPPDGWTFEIGDRVNHVSGIQPATVVGRTAAMKKNGDFSREITVILLDNDPGSGNVHYMLTEVLVPEAVQ